ncbi:glycosyltransferase family 2 protein [Micromonospora sp. WMMD1082]|uniref:glycosyltransferase family 2 protein n=1 Tax=Micromonospora sp. WMMD1082 TaxID=3016104 RepID=UPI002415F20D|nr:glycosyltransferase family 2 protein [Micromonospora sp. WMMD1082]MDG4793680.1 glycosyltransferase family 2 protein [Micromonospora sp. WMMD1082]
MAGRDCFRFVPRSLESVAAQLDSAVDVCVIDDASLDERQPEFMQRFCRNHAWTFIRNEDHRGSLYNHVAAVDALSPEPEDVIVSVDADDRLSGPDALGKVRAYYDHFQPLLTYGSYVPDPDDWRVMPAKHLPDEVIVTNAYRAFCARDTDEDPIWFNHLRTLKHSLFARLDPAIDFMHSDGSWFKTCYDLAITIPALEMASGRHLMLPEVLYIYTRDNPSSDCYIHTDAIERDKARIFSLQPKEPLFEIVVPPQIERLP